ncbi:Manganese transport system membrane protein MntB [Roseimaritima multifibrata]|uniref:Manganese transport system membrane protein MntB n=1 Tax=Roseimaritima multifibrata TaxID=1930274 RepID=A0A517MJ15_9BACT|nr:metal ABC transporter permease [Roseimaritima multifibrata]QDS94848.1 Manganese transport system membrane protein MntB [Roseimaritima multifibrata]
MFQPTSLLPILVWTVSDTWVVITAAIVAAACALPGCYLFLRKQSMLADALTHAILPGVIMAFLISGWLQTAGWLDPSSNWGIPQLLMLTGAMLSGLLTAWLAEWIGDSSWVRADAALGAVFTTMFAVGLILLSRFANRADIDLDCVLYGNLEMVGYSDFIIPRETVFCGVMLLVNVIAITVMFKELMITTFDPQLAAALGYRPETLHFALLAVTTATLVTAFEVVGSILVIGMLILPAATAFFITRRLVPMLLVAVFAAVLAAVGGYLAAITLPQPITRAFGLPIVEDVKASGMIILVAAFGLTIALLFGPERGVLIDRLRRSKRLKQNPSNGSSSPA